jgi:hypothetical protein
MAVDVRASGVVVKNGAVLTVSTIIPDFTSVIFPVVLFVKLNPNSGSYYKHEG